MANNVKIPANKRGQSGYLTNVAKSVGYASFNKLKRMNPTISQFSETNAEVFKTIYKSAIDYRTTYRRGVQAFKKSKFYEAGAIGITALKDDIRTGNLYNIEREKEIETKNMEAMVGGDEYSIDDSGFDLGGMDDLDNWDDDFNWDDEDNEDYNQDNIDKPSVGDAMIASSIEATSQANANAVSMAVARSAEYQSEISIKNTNLLYTHNVRAFGQMNSTLDAMNSNIGSVMQYFDNNLTKHLENSTEFFSTATPLLQDQVALLREIAQNTKPKEDESKKKGEENKKNKITYDSIVDGSGLPDFDEYVKKIGKNIQSYVNEQTMGMGSMLSSLGGDTNILASFAANPYGMIMDKMMDKLTPKAIERGFLELNKSIGGLFGSAITRFNTMANDKDGSMLSQAIGKIFGVKSARKSSIDTSNYEKGKVDWNGKSEKALTEIIPNKIDKIISLLSGKEETTYDYESGKYVTMNQLKTEYENFSNSFWKSASSDIREAMRSLVQENLSFDSKKERDQLIEDIDKVFKQLYERNELLDINNKELSSKYFDYGVSSNNNMAAIQALAQALPKSMWHEFNNKMNAEYSNQKEAYERNEKSGKYNILFNNSGYNQFAKEINGENNKKAFKTPFNQSELLDTKDDHGRNMFWYIQRMYAELHYIRKFSSGYGGGLSGNDIFIENNSGYRNKIFDNSFEAEKARTLTYSDKKKNEKSDAMKKREAEQRENERFLKDQAKRTDTTKKSYEVLANISNFDDPNQVRGVIGNIIDTNNTIKKVKATQEKGETLLDKVMAAKTLSEKTETIVEKMNILSKKPVEIMERSLTKADEHLFNLIYGKQGLGKEKEVTGFLDAMLFQLNETFYKFNNFMEEKILDPLKDKLGLDQDKSLFKGLMDKFGVSDKLNDAKEAAKERLSEITGAVKDSFKNIGRDIADTVKGTLSPLKDRFSRPNIFKPKNDEDTEEEDDDYDVNDYELTNIRNSYNKSSYKDVSNAEKRALRKKQIEAYNISKEDQKRRKVLDKLNYRIDTLFNSYESGFNIINDERFNDKLKSLRAKVNSLKNDIAELEKDPNTQMSRLNTLYVRLNTLEANLAKKENEYVQFRIANPEIDEDIQAYNREKDRLELARDNFKERHGLYSDEEVAGFKKDYEKDTFEYLRSSEFKNLSDEDKQAYLDEITGGADQKKIRELEKEIEKNKRYLDNPSVKESNKKYYQSNIDNAQRQIELLQGNTHVDVSKLFKQLNNELKYYKKINKNGKVDNIIKSKEGELQRLYDTFDMNYSDKYTNDFINTLSDTGNYSKDELNIVNKALTGLFKNNVVYDEDSFKNLNLQNLIDYRFRMMSPLSKRQSNLKTEMKQKGHAKNSPTARTIQSLGREMNLIDSVFTKLNNDLSSTFGTNLRGKNLTIDDVIKLGGTSIQEDQQESEWYKYAKENGTELIDKLDDETKNTSNIFTITQDILTELKSITSVFRGRDNKQSNFNGPRLSPFTLPNVDALNEQNTVRRRVSELTRNVTGVINDFFRDIPGFAKGGHIDKDQLAVVGKGEYIMTPEQRKQISEAVGGKIRSLNNSKSGILGKKDLNKEAKDIYSTIAGIMGKENIDPNIVIGLLSETGDAGQAFNELENVEESRAIVTMLKRVSHALSQRNEGRIDSAGNRTDVDPNSNIQDVFSETFKIYKRTIDKTMNSIMGEDPEKERTKAFKGMENILKDAKVNKGDLIVGGLLGAGTSILTGFLGGPLLGAAAGAATALTARSKGMQDMLFGEQEVDKDGNVIGRKGGIVPASIVNKVGKVLPDLKKFGITGAAVGLLPLIPFGPVGGLIMGSGVAFAKNNATVQEKLFGESGILPKEKLDKFKDRLPNILAGAGIGLGAQILGFSTPFGLVGNLILGSGLGFASKTDKFQKMIFGEWDEDEGKYIGGVIPYLKNHLVDPIIGKIKDTGNKIFDWAKRDIFSPIASAVAPITKQIQIMFQSVFGGIKNIVKGFVNDITTPVKQAIKETFKYITSPFRKLGSMLTRGFGKLLSALPRAIGAGGNALRKHQIRRGSADYMTASERLQFMDDERDSQYYYQEARDRMKNSRRQLTADMKDRFGGRELTNLQTWLTLGNYEEAEKVIRRNFGDTRDPESKAVMENMVSNLNEYKKYKDLHVTQKFGGATRGEKAKIGAIVRGEHEAAWKKYNEEHPENQVDYDTYMSMTQGEKFTENRTPYNLQSVDKFIAGASNDQLKNLQSHYEAINTSDKDYEKKKRVNGKKIRQLLKDLKLPWKIQRQITSLLDLGHYDVAMKQLEQYINDNGLSAKHYNKFDTLREEMKGFKETDKLRVDKDRTKAEFDKMLKEKFGDTTIFGRDITYEDFFSRIKGEVNIRRLKGIDITDEDVKDDPVQQDVNEITNNVKTITTNLDFVAKQLEGIFKVLTGEYNSEEAKKARDEEKKRLDDGQFRREEKMYSDEKTRLKYLNMMGYNSLKDAPAEFKYMKIYKLKEIAETYTSMETNDPEKKEMANQYYGGNIPLFMRKTNMDQIRKAQELYKRNPKTGEKLQQLPPLSEIKINDQTKKRMSQQQLIPYIQQDGTIVYQKQPLSSDNKDDSVVVNNPTLHPVVLTGRDKEFADKYYGGTLPKFAQNMNQEQYTKAMELYSRNVKTGENLPGRFNIYEPITQQQQFIADKYYGGELPKFLQHLDMKQFDKAKQLYDINLKTGENRNINDQTSKLDDEGNEIRMKRDSKSGEMEADLSDSSTKRSIGIKKSLREKQTQFYDKFLTLFKRDEKDDEKDEKKGGWLTKLLAALGIGKGLLGGAKNMLGGFLGKGLLGGLLGRGILGTVGKGALVIGGLMYLPQIIDLFKTKIAPALSESWQTTIKPWLVEDCIPMVKEGILTLAKSLPSMIIGTAKFIIKELLPSIAKGLGWDIGEDDPENITYDEDGNPVNSNKGTTSTFAIGANTATRYMVRKGSKYASKVSANVAESVAKKGGVTTVKESLTKEGAAKLAGKNITKTGIKDGLKNGLKTGLKTGKDFILHPIRTSAKGIVKGGKALGNAGGKQLGNLFMKMDAKRMGKNITKSSQGYQAKALSNVVDNSSVMRLINFCKERLIKLFSNPTVINLLGKVKNVPVAKQLIEKFIPKFIQLISKGATKLSGTALARAIGGISTGGIITAAFGVYDFVSGFNDARNIMGITEDNIPLGYRIAAGIVKTIQGVSIIATIVPTKNIMSVLIEVLNAIGVDMGNIKEKQEEAKNEVEQYNQEHGTNYSLEEYNSEVKGYKSLFNKAKDTVKSIGGGAVKAAAWVGQKGMDFGSMIGKWFTDSFDKAGKWINDWYTNTLKPWFDKAGKFLTNLFSWVGSYIMNPLGTTAKLIGNLVDWLSSKFDFIKNIRNWTTDKYNDAKEGITNTWNSVKSSVTDSFTKKPSKNINTSVSGIKTVNGISVGKGPEEENNIISEIKNSNLQSNIEDSISDYARDKVKTNTTKYAIKGVNALKTSKTINNIVDTGSTINKILNKIKSGLQFILNSKTVVNILGQTADGESIAKIIYTNFIPNFIRVASEKLQKSMPEVITRLSSKILSGGTTSFAFAVTDFVTGFENAESILGIVDNASFMEKMIAAVLEALKGFSILSVVPSDLVISLLFDALEMADIDTGNLGARREEAKTIVSNYNKQNGTDYNISSYNSEVLGRKGFFSSIANGISGGLEKVSSIFGRGEEDINGVPYYSQKQFGNSGFGKLMDESGCGPTATAMALSKVTGQNINPELIAKDALHNGSWDKEGARGNMFSTEASRFGVKTVDSGGDFDKFDKMVSAGIPTTVSGTVGKGEDSPYTSAGHIVTVVGKDKNGNYLVNDPRGKEYSKAYTKEEMMNGFRNSWSFGKGDDVQTSNSVHDTKVVLNKAKSMSVSNFNSKLFTKSMTPMNTVVNSIKDSGLIESAAKVLQEVFTKLFTNETIVNLLGNANGSNYSAASTLLVQFVPQLIKRLKQNCESNTNISANLRYIIEKSGVSNLSFLVTNFINGFNNPGQYVGKFDTYTTGMKVCAAIMSVIDKRFVIDRILTGDDWAKLMEDYVMPVFGESDADIKSIKTQAEKVIKNYTVNASSTAAQKQALQGIVEGTSTKGNGNIFSSITNSLGNIASSVGGKVKSVATGVGKFVSGIGNAIGGALGSALSWAKGLFGKGEYVGKGKKVLDKDPIGDARPNIGGLNNFPYFSQHDDYSEKPSLSETGCGPTSAAMVLSKITGKAVMPNEIADKSFDAGLYDSNGSNSALFPYIGNQYGVKVQSIDDFNKVKEYAKQGIPMVVSGKGGSLYGNSRDGHIVATFGKSKDGYIVNDPSSPNSNSLSEGELRNGFKEAWVFGDKGYIQDIKDVELVNRSYNSKDIYNEYDQMLTNMYYGKGTDPTTLTYVNGFPYWSQVAFGGDIMNAGCAPTATAMALTKITGKTVSPKDTVALAKKSGMWTANSGATSTNLIPYLTDKYGVKSQYVGSFDDASTYSAQGYPVIFDGHCVKSSQWSKNCILTPYSGSGHYVTAFGKVGNDFVVNDPRGSKYSGKRSKAQMAEGFRYAIKVGDKTFTVDQSKVKTIGSADGVENTGISGDGVTTDGTTEQATATDFFTDMATSAVNFTKKLFGFDTTDIATGSGRTLNYTGTDYMAGESVKASFTAYYPNNDSMEGGYSDSQGHVLNAAEQTCAAPNDVPIGTKIKISDTGTNLDGKIYTVTDRGSAIVIKNGVYRIDILVADKSACDAFKNCKGNITFMGKDDQQTQGTGDPIIDSMLYGRGESVDWGYFCDPSKGSISSYFGEKRSSYGNASGNHGALDYNIHFQPLYAPKSGVVHSENEHSSYGNSLTVETNTPGMYYRLAHMKNKAVSKGDKIKQGQYLGLSGDTGHVTGPHVHLEVLKGGTSKYSNGVDPLNYYGTKGKTITLKGSNLSFNDYIKNIGSIAEVNSSDTETTDIGTTDGTTEQATATDFFTDMATSAVNFTKKLFGFDITESSNSAITDSSTNYTTTSGNSDKKGIADRILSFIKSKGASDAASSGVLGNAWCETRFDPTARGKDSAGNYFGLFQWMDNYGQFEALNNIAKQRGVEWTDLDAQLNYMWSQLGDSTHKVWLQNQYKNGLDGFLSETDPYQAGSKFNKFFERGEGGATRGYTAQNIFKYIKNGKLTDDFQNYINADKMGKGSDTQIPLKSKIIEYALSFLDKGFTYSQEHRDYINNNKNASDCSSFTHHVFNRAAGTEIGGYSEEQYLNSKGKTVKRSDLKPADILLFKNTLSNRTGKTNYKDNVSHSSIYLGDDKFIESTNTQSGFKGIKVTDLNSNWSKQHFLTGKRFIDGDKKVDPTVKNPNKLTKFTKATGSYTLPDVGGTTGTATVSDNSTTEQATATDFFTDMATAAVNFSKKLFGFDITEPTSDSSSGSEVTGLQGAAPGDFLGKWGCSFETRGGGAEFDLGSNPGYADGYNYGIYQWNNKSDLPGFLKYIKGADSKFAKIFTGSTATNSQWKTAYTQYPEDFIKHQVIYEGKNWYGWQRDKIKKLGLNVDANRAYQEIAVDTANAANVDKVWKPAITSGAKGKDLIGKVMDNQSNYLQRDFGYSYTACNNRWGTNSKERQKLFSIYDANTPAIDYTYSTGKGEGNEFDVDKYFEDTLGAVKTSDFGIRDNEFHSGVDYAAEEDTPITSPIDGKVVENTKDDRFGFGNTLVIRDKNNKDHRFAHMKDRSLYGLGSKVRKNSIIGNVGNTGNSTGSHLHYEVSDSKGVSINPKDYMGKGGSTNKLDNVTLSFPDSNQKVNANVNMGKGNGVSEDTLVRLINLVIQLLTKISDNTNDISILVELIKTIQSGKSNSKTVDKYSTDTSKSKTQKLLNTLQKGLNSKDNDSTNLEYILSTLETIASE